ncbi:MAG: tetratricopeptide repeat protein [Bacteroidales bacterium]|nr:tetratricopeptide repeat protein [Bacteroidales bacterium]MDD4067535.1 tetratricopeptide repeat protein [Bacteroidales bacterium]MDD4739273.1 tetratricopeptide repeat protein [Bacteroidales bacterium]
MKKYFLYILLLAQFNLFAQSSADELFLNGVSHYNSNDFKQAYSFFKESANKGNYKSYEYLGKMYYYGNYVKKDFKEAYKWFEKSAKYNNDEAKLLLVSMYYNGEYVKKDTSRANKIVYELAIKGNPRAQYILGTLYFEKKDYTNTLNGAKKLRNKIMLRQKNLLVTCTLVEMELKRI